jgi:hypothetical protein
LHASLCVAPVSELTRMCAQPVAERALFGREVGRCFWFANTELRHGFAGTGLSGTPRLLYSGLEVLA